MKDIKTYHAYATIRFPIHEEEHPEILPDMILCGWMLRMLIRDLPVTTPLRFIVPREAAWDALSEGYPYALLEVEIIGGKAAMLDNPEMFNAPYDEARLIAADWQAVIHYRRVRECIMDTCEITKEEIMKIAGYRT